MLRCSCCGRSVNRVYWSKTYRVQLCMSCREMCGYDQAACRNF